MAYYGSGQRVEKLVPSAMSVYVYDAFGALAAQYSSSANTAACTTCYLSMDHLGSVRLVTNQNGIVVARHDYLPFGEEIPASTVGRNGQWGSTTDVAGKFTGQMRDTETGLDFFNARYFGAALGRFTSPDPANAGADLADPQTWNGYGYVRGNPMALTDPTGMWDVGGWDGGGGCDWFDPLCWPVSPCFFFDCVGGGSSGGGSHGSGDSGGTVSNTHKSTPMPPNSFPGGETLGLPPGMRVPLPSPAVLLGLGLNLDCEFGVCVGNDALSAAASVKLGRQVDDTVMGLYVDFRKGIEIWLHGRNSGAQPGSDVVRWAAQQHTPVHGPWTYGNWCGTGGSSHPIDQNDRACMVHDYCYAQGGFTAGDNLSQLPAGRAAALQGCNQALCNSENRTGGFTGWQIKTFFTRIPRVANACH